MHDLAGGDDHDDDREDLPVAVAPHPREGDQRDVGGVEHELEAQQDHQRVAPREHAGGADREDQRADHEVPVEAHQPPSESDPPVRAGSPPPGPGSSGSRELCPPTRLGHRADAGRQPEVHDRDAIGLVGADAAAPAREHDGADGGDEQQERRDLEGQQELRQQQLADRGPGVPKRGVDGRRRRCRAPSAPSRARRWPARRTAPARRATADHALAAADRRAAGARRGAADVGDDEDVEHHHRAGVDDDLRRGDELRRAAAGRAPPARAGGRRARAPQ